MRIPKALSRGSGALLAAVLLAACGGEEQPEVAEVETEAAPAPAPVAEAPVAGGPATGALPAGVTAEMVQQGQQIFTGPGICFTCHGQEAQGTQLAPNLTDSEWLWIDPAASDTYTQLTTLIQTGVSEPKEHPAPMPAMGAQLTEEQVAAVAAYVYSISPLGR
jgi:mono/diheme cytochrome c family protein